jgi:formate-dependent nitrite reductase membrane component NrfD
MRFYLKIVNPIISLLVLIICLYSGTFENGNFDIHLAINGGIPTYFLAKGLFCCSALFILGKILEKMMYPENGPIDQSTDRDSNE